MSSYSSVSVWLLVVSTSLVGCASGDGATIPINEGDFAGTGAGVEAAGTGAAGQAPAAGTQGVDDGDPTGTGTAGVVSTAGTSAADGGTLDVDAASDAGPTGPKPRCLTKGSQVALLGDSYINWVSHTFPADLNREAGQTYRNYAVGGYSMGSGGLGKIPPQLDQAVKEDPDIVALVMTGGGNDVLVADTAMYPKGGDCKMSMSSPTIPDCQKIVDKALEAADDMLNKGVAAGIEHVVYFFYPNVPEGTVVGGTYPNAILEYAAPLVKDFCDSTLERTGGKAACYFVDLRPAFSGHPEYFAPADIHPNTMGSAVMAKTVWQKMKDNCIAQPASSGCCEP
jgi:GDSL-like Lipase/Acylhydrolase family